MTSVKGTRAKPVKYRWSTWSVETELMIKRRASYEPNPVQPIRLMWSSTDFVWSGWGVLHAWPAMNNAWWPNLGQTPIFTWVEQHNQRSKGVILSWRPTRHFACRPPLGQTPILMSRTRIIKGPKAPFCLYLEKLLTIKTAFVDCWV